MNDMCDNQWLFEFDKSFLHVSFKDRYTNINLNVFCK